MEEIQEITIVMEFKKPIDFLTYQLKQQFYFLSENELKMLAIIYLKGLTAEVRKGIVSMGVFKSKQSVENHLSKFRALGIMEGDNVKLKYPLIKANKAKLNINVVLK